MNIVLVNISSFCRLSHINNRIKQFFGDDWIRSAVQLRGMLHKFVDGGFSSISVLGIVCKVSHAIAGGFFLARVTHTFEEILSYRGAYQRLLRMTICYENQTYKNNIQTKIRMLQNWMNAMGEAKRE